jgi:hypothetical protein
LIADLRLNHPRYVRRGEGLAGNQGRAEAITLSSQENLPAYLILIVDNFHGSAAE